VVTPDPEEIKVAKVLMVEEEILGVDKVTVEEDMIVVAQRRKKQNLVADGFAFSVEQVTGHE